MTSEYESSRKPRFTERIQAHLIDSRGDEIPIVVKHLSCGEFRLETDRMLDPGERVMLRVGRRKTFKVEIQWSSRDQAGGRFLEPVEFFDSGPR